MMTNNSSSSNLIRVRQPGYERISGESDKQHLQQDGTSRRSISAGEMSLTIATTTNDSRVVQSSAPHPTADSEKAKEGFAKFVTLIKNYILNGVKATQKEAKIDKAQTAINGVETAGTNHIANLQVLDHAILKLEMLKTKSGIKEGSTNPADQKLQQALSKAKEKRALIVAAHPDDAGIARHEQTKALTKIYSVSTEVGPTIFKKGTSTIERFLKSTLRAVQTATHKTPMDAIATILRHTDDPSKMKMQDILMARSALKELKKELTGPNCGDYNLSKNDDGSFSLIDGKNPEVQWLPEDCDAALALLDDIGDKLHLTPTEIQALTPAEIQCLNSSELDVLGNTIANECLRVVGLQPGDSLDDVVFTSPKAQRDCVENNKELFQTYALILTAKANLDFKSAAVHPSEAYDSSVRFDNNKAQYSTIKRDLAGGNRNWTIVTNGDVHKGKDFIGSKDADKDTVNKNVDNLHTIIGDETITRNLLHTSNQAQTSDLETSIQLRCNADPIFVAFGLRLNADPHAPIVRNMDINDSGNTRNTIATVYQLVQGEPWVVDNKIVQHEVMQMQMAVSYEYKTEDLKSPLTSNTSVQISSSFKKA